MEKLRVLLIPILLLMLCACQDGLVTGGKIKFNIPETKPTITQVKIVNNQLIVIGNNLSNVTIAKVEGSTNHSFTIETKTSEKLILNAKSALGILVGQTLNLIVASAEASATFPISFELQNGQVTAAKLHPMGATSGQVLRFNGTSWAPASLTSSQLYAGTYNASTDTPDIVTLGGPTGTYYIVTTSGSQNFGSGLVNFDVGDWVIYNGASWERVPVSGNTVSSFNGRTGIVVPLNGDYSWSMLTKASGKLTGSRLEEIADVDITGIQDGDIIRWNNSTLKWEVDALPTMTIVAGSISSTELASSSVTSAKITDGSIVDADISATANIAQSKILNLAASLAAKEPVITAGTTLQYLRGDKSLATLNTTVVPEGTNEYFTQARVRQTPLTGYAVGTAIPLAATDTVLEGLGKLEAQNAAISAAQGNYVLLDGTDAMTGSLQMGNNKITGLATPTANTDAATKAYVDSVAGGGGSSQWTTAGSDIYYNTGNIGIGTNSPATSLHILSNQPSSEVHPNRAGLILESEGTSVGGRLALKVYSDTESPLFVGYRARGTKASPTALLLGDQIGGFAPVGYDGTGGWQTGAHIRYNTTENWSATNLGSSISFRTPANGSTSALERMKVDHNGNVGIGTSTPQAKLDVKGTLLLSGSASGYVGFAPAAAAGSTIYTLPVADGSDGDLLKTNGAGVLTWVPPQSGAPSGTAGGDLDGTYPNPTVKTGLSVTKLAGGTVDNTEFEYLNGVTSNLQTQLDAKEDAITAGTTLQYLRGDKSLATLNTTVVPEGTNEYFTQGKARATPISGYAVGTAIPLAATDTFMEAFGKLEAQIIANDTAFDSIGHWSKNLTDIYYSSGNVGIGTNTPAGQFHLFNTTSGLTPKAEADNLVIEDATGAGLSFLTENGFSHVLDFGFRDTTLGDFEYIRIEGVRPILGGPALKQPQLNFKFMSDGVTELVPLSIKKSMVTIDAPITLSTTNGGTISGVKSLTHDAGGSVGMIIGGAANSVISDHNYSVIVGGSGNTISAGIGTDSSSIFGGIGSTVTGSQSIAMGLSMSVSGYRSFGIGLDSSTPAYDLSQDNTMAIMGGNVGIGTTTPSMKLSVAGNTLIQDGELSVENEVAGVSGRLNIQGQDDGFNYAAQYLYNDDWSKYWAIGHRSEVTDINNFFIEEYNGSTYDIRLAIKPGGNVGIGTSTPTSALQVIGEISATSMISPTISGAVIYAGQLSINSSSPNYSNAAIRNSSTSGVSGFIYNDSAGSNKGFVGHINSAALAPYPAGTLSVMGDGVPVTLGVNGNEIIRIRDDTGNVGIGQSVPVYKLDVEGDVNIGGAYALRFGGTQVCTSVGCTSSSDERLKENINPLGNALEKILQIQGVEYDYKNKEKFTDKHQIGVIAQDVEKVYPEAVLTDPESGLKSVAYDHLIAPVIEALRELNQKIIELFSDSKRQSREIASIKEENAKLKQENAEIKAYLCRKDPGAPICVN